MRDAGRQLAGRGRPCVFFPSGELDPRKEASGRSRTWPRNGGGRGGGAGETGLYYYRARYYDPKVGRFISEDPIGFVGGVNFYAYVNGNPASFVDPLGLKITVTGYVSSDNAQVLSLLNTLTTTQWGQQNLNPLITDQTRNLTITLGARTRYNPETDTLYFNPNATVPLEAENGWEFAAAIIALAHELGHATAPECSTYDEQRAVNFAENAVRRELGFPLRVSYWPKSIVTPPPPWALEWSRTAVAR